MWEQQKNCNVYDTCWCSKALNATCFVHIIIDVCVFLYASCTFGRLTDIVWPIMGNHEFFIQYTWFIVCNLFHIDEGRMTHTHTHPHKYGQLKCTDMECLVFVSIEKISNNSLSSPLQSMFTNFPKWSIPYFVCYFRRCLVSLLLFLLLLEANRLKTTVWDCSLHTVHPFENCRNVLRDQQSTQETHIYTHTHSLHFKFPLYPL